MAKLFVLALALLAQQSLAFFQNEPVLSATKAPEVARKIPEGVCESIQVTLMSQITLKMGEHIQPVNGTLFRLCNSTQLIDLTKGVQFVHIFAGHNGTNNYNNDNNFGDRFIARRDDDLTRDIPIIVTPQVGKYTMDDVAKYEMIPSMWISRGVPKKYATQAEVVYETSSWHGETIQLLPGWTGKLAYGEMLEQTIIPKPYSKYLKEQRKVTVMAGWYNISQPTDGLLAYLDKPTNGQFITLFFQRPNPNDPFINPRFTNATITAELSKNHIPKQKIQFFPGWRGELKNVSVQFMIPGPDSTTLRAQTVVVYPKYYTFKGDEGFHCDVDLLYNIQTVSVYFDPNTVKDGDDRIKGPDGVVYLEAQTVPQYNQSLSAEKIKLSPGWTGILEMTVNQTLIPEADSEFLVKQQVTIVPGWGPLFVGHEGISVFVGTEHSNQYVSMYFSKPPNPTKH